MIVGVIVLISGLAAAPVQRPREPAPKPRAKLTAQVEADFHKRVEDYEALSKKLASKLPRLSKNSTPQEIDRDQRAMEQLIVQARANAKQGDMFPPGMQTFVRDLLADVFSGPRGAEARKAVHDEVPDEFLAVKPVINKRYPDEVPLSTMPPRVLARLPKIPDELEYRFVGDNLILMDAHAHIILDFVANAIPAPPAAK
jgi:hypothetical protein